MPNDPQTSAEDIGLLRRLEAELGVKIGRPWRRVILSAECDADGNCPVCAIDYSVCLCPGPHMEDSVEYAERDGVMFARPLMRKAEP